MKCIDCANCYYDLEATNGFLIGLCRNPDVYIPPYPNNDCEERECKFFKEKSGISKWDSMSDNYKKLFNEKLKEMYENPKMSFNERFTNFDDFLEFAKREFMNMDSNSY